MLKHALGYAAAGLPVIPLSGKIPRTDHGKDDATTDPKTIRAWWTRWPHANIGVRPPEGLVVLDVDPRHGGHVELSNLEQRHGQLPQTLTCRTGSGGLHIWLAYFGPARGKLAAGIDIKRHTGYLVAPPSIHPDTGLRYEWFDTLIGTAPAPAWVRLLLNPPPPPVLKLATVGSKSNGRALVDWLAAQTYGNVNDALYWAAGKAAQTGILDDIAEDLVNAAHQAAGAHATAKGEHESRRTIQSARMRWGAR